MEFKKITIKNEDGSEEEVDVVCILANDDGKQYMAYTKGEKKGDDILMYVSSLIVGPDGYEMYALTDEDEYQEVIRLLNKKLEERD